MLIKNMTHKSEKHISPLAVFTAAFVIWIFFNILFISPSDAETEEVSVGSVAVFGIYGSGDKSIRALTEETADSIRRTFNNLGRFMPVENNLLNEAYDRALKNNIKGNIYKEAAKITGADIYVTVIVSRLGDFIYSDLNVAPVDQGFTGVEKKQRFRSRILGNIPLKVCREIASAHKGLPARAAVKRKYNDNLCLISAGEWQGLKNGGNYSIDKGSIEVIQAGRFESIVRLSEGKRDKGDVLLIETYPDIQGTIDDMEARLAKNAVRKFGLGNSFLKGGNPENRMLESLCLINVCGNLCLPGYGAFLSTQYLGFKEGNPDYLSIAVSTTAIFSHILIPEFMTGFEINVLPFKDGEKSVSTHDLQIFLWAALPLTFSVAYMDQLAFQFSKNRTVPPFFDDKDNMAAVLSVLIPGGGLFYKGLRLAGWGYYFSEMSLAGYGIYNMKNDNGIYALSALAVVKIIDILYAFFAVPSYDFYNIEKEREIKRVSIDIGFDNKIDGNRAWNVLAVLRY